MVSVGIITYHSAYNFGSALQALATQMSIESLGYSSEIINYRMKMQYDCYAMYRLNCGVKKFLKDIVQLPVHSARKTRKAKYELFFSGKMNLSKEFAEPEDAAEIWGKYDVAVSGSDQIWNKHSNELEHNAWKYMDPYLLKGFNGKKISYASSVANMTDDELRRIVPYIKEFDSVSMREGVSAEKLSKMTGRTVESVLDPTFLLTKDKWIKALDLKAADEEPYILYYSLGPLKNVSKHNVTLKKLSEKLRCKVKMVTPFALLYHYERNFENHPEYGPVDFLSALYNAKAVVTDSYHGTILSANFGKDFYSICGLSGSEFRKTDILRRLGLEERIIYNASDIAEKAFAPIDYESVNEKLDKLREHSLDYLRKVLES